MRSLYSLLVFLFLSSIGNSQIKNPVTWDFQLDKEDDYYVISAEATIADPWVVYSHFTEDGGPVGTTLEINETIKGVTKIDELWEEGMMIKEFSKLFDLDVTKFKKKVTFKQKLKIDATTSKVKGYINFMTCDGNRCLPPSDVEFSFDLE